MVIDYSTPLGKIRMRIGDVSDLPFLSDSIINSVYEEKSQNITNSVIVCAQMILAQLSFKTHRKLQQLEVFGSEAFNNYKQFLLLTVTNPAFMDISPIPVDTFGTNLHPLIQFQQDWNKNYADGTQSQQLHWDALGSPDSSDIWYWPA